MKNVLIKGSNKYLEQDYKKEADLTELFSKHYKKIVSDKSFWIKLEKQYKSKKFKNYKHSIGDGLLLLWDNPTTPSLYITEIELERHDLDQHILPQIGNFISFIQSASIEELTEVRNCLYQELKKNKNAFDSIRSDTNKEVYEVLDNALEDLQMLIVIDKINPEMSIGLSQIEKAIKVKIRKIEILLFLSNKNDEIILFNDSEELEDTQNSFIDESRDEYTLGYHLENKSEKIHQILTKFVSHARKLKLRISPMKHYIGFFKNDKMIFSSVLRKNSIIFYSKAKINEFKYKILNFRDVRKIGHYTNHFPSFLS